MNLKNVPIVAYQEREWESPATGLPVHVRDEWRVIDLKAMGLYGDPDLYRWLQPILSQYATPRRFVLEHRRITNGVDEGWHVFDHADRRETSLLWIDAAATPVDGELIVLRDRLAKAAVENALKEERRQAQKSEAEAERRIKEQSRAAWERMRMSPVNRYQRLAEEWDEQVRRLQGICGFPKQALQHGRFMELYLTAMRATTVPAKAKAIRQFVAELPRLETEIIVQAQRTGGGE